VVAAEVVVVKPEVVLAVVLAVLMAQEAFQTLTMVAQPAFKAVVAALSLLAVFEVSLETLTVLPAHNGPAQILLEQLV
jgi:hypothetical protein